MPCKDLIDFDSFKEVFTPYNAVLHKKEEETECVSSRYWITNREYVDAKNFRFNLLDKKRVTILGNICCADKDFFSHGGKKYVWINNIRLKPEFKAKKVVKKFSKKWDKKYIEKGFSALALDAIDDGIIAWHRLGFDYKNITDEVVLKALFADYLKEVKNIEIDDIDLKKVDSDLFFDDERVNFTQWIKQKDSTMKIPMIRRLA